MDAVNAVTVTRNGKYVISGAMGSISDQSDTTIKVWELATGRLIRTLEGHVNAVNALVVTPDGSRLLSASSDFTIKYWDIATGELLRTFDEHAGPVNTVVISPDGSYFVSGSSDKTIKHWNILNGTCQTLFASEKEILSLCLSTDGDCLLCGDGQGRIWIFDWIH
jgi:WD40 repeat protein